MCLILYLYLPILYHSLLVFWGEDFTFGREMGLRGMSAEIDIVKAMQRDPQTGFRMLMAAYMQPLYWHVRRLVVGHEDAQDVVQETLVRAFRFFHRFEGDCSLKTWLFTIATNEALRWLGSKKQFDSLPLDEATANLLQADSAIEGDAIEARLQRAILNLPAKQQLAFNLRYYNEMSYEDIARVVGSSASAAKANYHFAKEKIIQYMNSND